MPQTAKDRRDESRRKGMKSLSRKGDKDYTTKRGDKVFHRKGKDVRRKRMPYQKRAKHRAGGTVAPRRAKPLREVSRRSTAPPNVYMGGNRASYVAPPPNRPRRDRGKRRMPKH